MKKQNKIKGTLVPEKAAQKIFRNYLLKYTCGNLKENDPECILGLEYIEIVLLDQESSQIVEE